MAEATTARREGEEGSVTERELPTSWWWTESRGGCCDECREPTKGTIIAFDSGSRTVLCQICADEQGVADECRESKRARKFRAQLGP